MDSYFDSMNYSPAKLDISTKEICGYKINDNFTFYTSGYKNNLNIKKYYLLGKNKNHSWGAPWYKDKRPAHTITKKSDLQKINKEMFFLKEVFPKEKKVIRNEMYTKITSCPTCKKKQEIKNRKVNATELNFSLNLNTFSPYSLTEGYLGEINLEFILLGIDYSNNVIVLTDTSSKRDMSSKALDFKNTSLDFSIGLGLMPNKELLENICKREIPKKEPFYRLNQTKVSNLFKKLDTKFNYSHIIFSNSNIQDKKRKNIKYERLILKLQNKISPYISNIDNEISKIFRKDISSIINNEKRLIKLIQKRTLLDEVYKRGKDRVYSIRDFLNKYKNTSGTLSSDITPRIGNTIDYDKIRKYYAYISNKEYKKAFDMKHSYWYDLKYFEKLYKNTYRIEVLSITKLPDNSYSVETKIIEPFKTNKYYKAKIQIINGKLKHTYVKEIKKEEKTILIERKKSPSNFTVDTFHDFEEVHIKGNKKAQISFIQYCDLEGPFCAKMHNEGTIDFILNKYNGKVNFIFKHFPLDFHENAKDLAIAAECVARVGGSDKYYDFIKNIYKKKGKSIIAFEVSKLKLYNRSYKECLTDLRPFVEVDKDTKEGKKYGVTGTPGNIIKNNKTGSFVSLTGAYPKENFIKLIDNMLEQQKNQNSWAN